MFERIRTTLARWVAPTKPPKTGSRMYGMARPSRLTAGWGQSTSSEDAELSSSLRTGRNRSRELMRDCSYAKRIKQIIVNNVVGTGIGIQAQVMTSRDQLNERINDEIEAVFEEQGRAEFWHTGGQLAECEMDRMIVGQVVEAGEVFLREHYQSFGGSRIPYALEVIEAERIADDLYPDGSSRTSGVRLGIEMDAFHRPTAYLIRQHHPGDLRVIPGQTDRVERVPADQIIHVRLIDRWPQTRAMPWLHAAARRLNDMEGYSEAEIVAARYAAAYMGIFETPQDAPGDEQDDGSMQIEISPGIMMRTRPGEKFTSFAPNRPNAAMDPFMRMMLREACAGTGPSYESVSRDYSQSNYSSSRMGLLDDRDLWRALQRWFIRQVKQRVHRRRLHQAVLARAIPSIRIDEYAINPGKFEAARFKPRGWSWIDPKSEVEAYIRAIEAGFMTVSEVIALTGGGRDLEDVLNERERELKAITAKGLVFVTNPDMMQAKHAPAPPIEAKPEKPAKDDAEDLEDEDRFHEILAAGVGGRNGHGH